MTRRVTISRRTGRPVVCSHCGESHRDLRDLSDPDDCDPGCDWDRLSGNWSPS